MYDLQETAPASSFHMLMLGEQQELQDNHPTTVTV